MGKTFSKAGSHFTPSDSLSTTATSSEGMNKQLEPYMRFFWKESHDKHPGLLVWVDEADWEGSLEDLMAFAYSEARRLRASGHG